MTFRPLPFFVIAASFLAGCSGQPGIVYRTPQGEAHALLAQSQIPDFLFGDQNTEQSVDGGDPASIRWRIFRNGEEILDFVATLKPESETATRISVDVVAPSNGRFARTSERLKQHPEIKSLYLDAARETVASTLEHRPFEPSQLAQSLAVAAITNAKSIMGPSGEELEKKGLASIHDAYEREAAGAR